MLQWHAGSWDHRAYWGENLIDWGVDGTVSRARAGELPEPGVWLQLSLPASLVGLEGLAADGMAFTLYDGQAAFAMTGSIGASGRRTNGSAACCRPMPSKTATSAGTS